MPPRHQANRQVATLAEVLDQFFILYTIRRSSYVNLGLSYPLSMTMPVRYTFKLSEKIKQ